MATRHALLTALLVSCAAPLALTAGSGAALASGPLCERAGAAAEKEHGLPDGLLLAIGRVESGRWDPHLGRVTPWPWAVNVAGAGNLSASRDGAIGAVRDAQASGQRNIDVGCFQVNLMHHPNAFATLDDAFDPYTNARYAARLLVSAKQRLGTWTAAVEAYHSANPARAIPYGRAVMGRWTEAAGAAVPSQPVSAHGMKVWTPSPTGSAPSMIAIPPAAPGGRTVVVLPAPHR